ncbi:hypothetical protein E2C01_033720 [Portunus trituberculatus]|uniref:Uncharacterized protein n=1 Tax=Portunus trituberculatus TaxID=210409 RepID=A0A5B7F3F3_PORTR|nr:hypothetical protein [Portunus trituberculatus]
MSRLTWTLPAFCCGRCRSFTPHHTTPPVLAFVTVLAFRKASSSRTNGYQSSKRNVSVREAKVLVVALYGSLSEVNCKAVWQKSSHGAALAVLVEAIWTPQQASPESMAPRYEVLGYLLYLVVFRVLARGGTCGVAGGQFGRGGRLGC